LSDGLVLDSWAVLAYLLGEPAGAVVKSILIEAAERGTSRWISNINLGEIWYSLARRHSAPFANQQLQALEELGIERIDADWPLTLQAAHYKSRHKMSYADAFAAALSKARNAPLITGDAEFRSLEKEIKIHWV
jgi:PIN domain nuclease of toxin-antitoxin system